MIKDGYNDDQDDDYEHNDEEKIIFNFDQGLDPSVEWS